GNWTKSGDGSAIVGHHDRLGLKDTWHMRSWNSSYGSRGCSQEQLKSSGAPVCSTASRRIERTSDSRFLLVGHVPTSKARADPISARLDTAPGWRAVFLLGHETTCGAGHRIVGAPAMRKPTRLLRARRERPRGYAAEQ